MVVVIAAATVVVEVGEVVVQYIVNDRRHMKH